MGCPKNYLPDEIIGKGRMNTAAETVAGLQPVGEITVWKVNIRQGRKLILQK
jgi:hypothetical protein